MNDVAYRINTSLPVTKEGVIVLNTLPTGQSVKNTENRKSIANESPSGSGYVNRFDDPTYYTA